MWLRPGLFTKDSYIRTGLISGVLLLEGLFTKVIYSEELIFDDSFFGGVYFRDGALIFREA